MGAVPITSTLGIIELVTAAIPVLQQVITLVQGVIGKTATPDQQTSVVTNVVTTIMNEFALFSKGGQANTANLIQPLISPLVQEIMAGITALEPKASTPVASQPAPAVSTPAPVVAPASPQVMPTGAIPSPASASNPTPAPSSTTSVNAFGVADVDHGAA